MVLWIVVILAVPVMGYALLIGWMIYGWLKRVQVPAQALSATEYVSIVLPARNEEASIKRCLDSLIAQDYPEDKIQIIVVSDASQDNTDAVTQAFISEHQERDISLIRMGNSTVPGQKKRALARAIGVAKGRLILTTDADVTHSSAWVRTMVACRERTGSDMIAGPVQMNGTTFFEKLQALEFAGLTGFGEASFAIGHPVMCNGANLGFTKDAFDSVGGYDGIDAISSGDDVLLMHKMMREKKYKVRFVHSRYALVTTNAARSVQSFIRQRVRWASKSAKISEPFYRISAIFVLSAQLSLLIAGLLSLFFVGLVEYFCMLLAIKLVVDFLFLFLVTAHYNSRRLMWYYLPGVLYGVLYIPVVSLLTLRGSYYWKGRQTY